MNNKNSLQIVQRIVKDQNSIKKVVLLAHKVGLNWRQKNNTPKRRRRNFLKSFEGVGYTKTMIFDREDFLNLRYSSLEKLGKNEVWSISSKVNCGKDNKHFPMMNFHPEEGISTKDIEKLIKKINPNKKGFLLHSGKFYHYYGNFLLRDNDWACWLGKWLTPCIFVSPRYIGLRLQEGYATLRLTSENKFKPKIPQLISEL